MTFFELVHGIEAVALVEFVVPSMRLALKHNLDYDEAYEKS